mmetsp:Transcript_51112/g.118800  ORF Transcript_51112/g.118800 Transcript_51112/m.118800 type:complete len:382 (+) Transcript_51112:2-1147(+)
MESIPESTDEEARLFPYYMRELQQWLHEQGKTDSLVRQITRSLLALFEDDNKGLAAMASPEYYELTRVSPRNISGHNQRSSAVRYLQRWWGLRGAKPPEETGDIRNFIPKRRAVSGASPRTDSATAPLSDVTPKNDIKLATPANSGASALKDKQTARQKKRRQEKSRKRAMDEVMAARKRRVGEEGSLRKTFAPLIETSGVREVYEQAKMLVVSGGLRGAICIIGRESARKNSSVNGVYVNREKLFHGRISYKKEGSDRFLFFSATKGAWKVSDNLDDQKTGFAFAKVDDKGQVPPCDPKRPLAWRVFDGKPDGYKKDDAVRCLSVKAFLQVLAPEWVSGEDSMEESAGEQGSQSSGGGKSGSASDSSSSESSENEGRPPA